MATKNFTIPVDEQAYKFEGRWNNTKKGIELIINDRILFISCQHKDDLDNIQDSVKKNLDEVTKAIKTGAVIDHSLQVIKGLETIMEKHPDTKKRLASLTSQVKNVLINHDILKL